MILQCNKQSFKGLKFIDWKMKDFYFFVLIPLQQFQKVNKAESDQIKKEVQCLKPSHVENLLM